MKPGIHVTGHIQVIANLRDRKGFFAKGTEKGIKLAALYLFREAQLRVPVDLGNLKASGSVRHEGSGFKTVAGIVYTAAYAIFVHENVEMKGRGLPRPPGHKGNYWDPPGRGQAKFLEEPARTERDTLVEIVRESARVK